jgi:hypothetical protein
LAPSGFNLIVFMKGIRGYFLLLYGFLAFFGGFQAFAADGIGPVRVPVEPVLNAPSGITQSGFTLTWVSVPDATDYWLDVSIDNFGTYVGSFQDFATGNVGSFDVTGLAPGLIYQCRLRATDGVDNSGYSNVVTVTSIPATPDGLMISNITPTAFQLNWNAVVGFDNFFADLSTDNFSSYVENNLSVGGPTAHVFTGLQSGTEYQVRIRSANVSGSSPNSIELAATTQAAEPADAPTGLVFFNISTNTFNVNFTAVASATTYLVLRKADSAPSEIPVDGNAYTAGNTFISSDVVYVGSATGFSESGLDAGVVYYYSIFSFNGTGSSTNYYTSASLTGSQSTFCEAPILNSPTNITQSGATISWNAIAGASNYGIDVSSDGFVNFVPGLENYLTGNVTSFDITGLSAGISYGVRIRTVNAAGQSTNSTIESVLTLPANPTGLTLTGITPTGFTLNWDGITGASSYRADISVDGFSNFVQENVSVTGTSHSFSGLAPETNYEVRLSSINTSGESGNSTSVSFSTFALEPTTAPSDISFSNVASTSFDVSFTAAIGSPDYLVLRKVGSDPTETPVDGVGYTAGTVLGTSDIVFVGSGTSFSQTALSAGTTYHYVIFSFDGSGVTANYRVSSSLAGNRITISNAPILNAPTAVAQTGATISWNTVSGASGYSIDVSPDGFVNFVSGMQDLGLGNVTSYGVTGLNAGVTYNIRVRADNPSGSSVNSNTQTVLTIPANPTGLMVSAVTSNGFTLNWSDVTGASSYRADISVDGFSNFVEQDVSATGTSHSFTGLSPETLYEVRLRSINASGESGNSSSISFSTFAGEPVGAPSNLIFSNVANTSFDVSFTAATDNPDYLVLRKVGSDPTETPVDGVGYTAGTLLGTSDIVFFGSGTNFSQTALSAGTTYHYVIYSFDGSGVTTNYHTTTALAGQQITTPNAPIISNPTDITQTDATLSWGAVPSATAYFLDVSTTNFSSYVSGFENKPLGNVLTFNLTGLTHGQEYQVRLRAANTGGASSPSNVVTILTIPATPDGLVVSGITESGFTLTWNAISNTSGFLADLSTDGFASIIQTGIVLAGPTSHVFTGLNSGETYSVRIRSVNTSGTSPNSTTATASLFFAEPAGQPTNLVFNAITVSGFAIGFTAAPNTPNYVVLRKTGSAPTEVPVDGTVYSPGSSYGLSTVVYVGANTSVNETSLTAGTNYFYTVYSFNGNGSQINYREASPLQGNQFTTTLAPVLSNATALSQTSGTVSWSVVSSATDYALDVSTDGFNSFVNGYQNLLTGNVTSMAISGLATATSYQVRLRTVNPGGQSDPSNIIILLTIPATPTGLVASSPTSSGAVLNWNAVAGATSFVTDVSSDDFSSFIVQNLTLSATPSHTFTGLPSATTLQVRLRSVNGSGQSPSSTTVQFTTLANEPTVAPSLLMFNTVTTNSFNASFTGALGSPNYIIMRKEGGAPTEIPVDGTVYTPGSSLGLSTIVQVGSATSFSQASLSAGTSYFYIIYAFNGTGVATNYLTTSWLSGSQATRCVSPALASAFNVEQTSLSVSWTAVTGATDYALDITTDGTTFVPGFQGKLVGNSTTYLVTGLSAGLSYQIRIRAVNSAGESANSNAISTLTIPATPGGLVASNITATGFTLSWNSVVGFDNFRIDISPDDFTNFTYNDVSIPGPTAFTISGLASATTFKVRLRSVNASGTSPNSATLTVSTVNIINPLTMGTPAFNNELGTTPVPVTVEVTGGTNPKVITLHYRGITATDFTAATIPLKAGTSAVYETSITSAMADELGLEFFITAMDAATVEVETANHYFMHRVFDGAQTLNIPFNMSAFNGKAKTYQLFSVPYILENKSIAAIFDAQLGASGKDSWRMFHYENDAYVEYPDGLTQMELGKGYWFNSLDRSFSIDVGSASVFEATPTESFEMTLQQGWNQIGDPYPFNLDWDAIKTANPAVGLNSFFGFENGSFVKKSTLGAWKGGFVFADNGGVVSFPVSAKTLAGGREQSSMGANLDDVAWLLPITISAGEWTSESGIGMHPAAQSGKDRWDELTLPRFIDYVEMRTLHPEFFAPHFATDVVPTAESSSWEFELTSNLDEKLINLQWDMQPLANAAATLMLLDEGNDVLVNMKTVGSYKLQLRDNHRIRIIFNKMGEFKSGITELNKAFPNPYEQQFTIPVYTTEPNTPVEVVVYDSFGKTIGTYQQQFLNTGYGEITCDGSSVSNGLLFYRVHVNGVAGNLKRLIKR